MAPRMREITLALLLIAGLIPFPYPEGAFRDTLTLADDGASGTLLLGAQKDDGSWSTFASYTLKRLPHSDAR
jgi:hypothetical protein